jgi:hypothetical protein
MNQARKPESRTYLTLPGREVVASFGPVQGTSGPLGFSVFCGEWPKAKGYSVLAQEKKATDLATGDK